MSDPACVDTYVDVRADTCVDTYRGMRADTRVDMCVDTYVTCLLTSV